MPGSAMGVKVLANVADRLTGVALVPMLPFGRTMPISRGIPHLTPNPVLIAVILLGLLSMPAECSLWPGPHSLFFLPPNAHLGHHAEHPMGDEAATDPRADIANRIASPAKDDPPDAADHDHRAMSGHDLNMTTGAARRDAMPASEPGAAEGQPSRQAAPASRGGPAAPIPAFAPLPAPAGEMTAVTFLMQADALSAPPNLLWTRLEFAVLRLPRGAAAVEPELPPPNGEWR